MTGLPKPRLRKWLEGALSKTGLFVNITLDQSIFNKPSGTNPRRYFILIDFKYYKKDMTAGGGSGRERPSRQASSWENIGGGI